MKPHKIREIVIEFEKVQVIRRRARTQFLHCRMCRHESDFISIKEASSLFETNIENLLSFIQKHHSHFEIQTNGEVFLCLTSLLAQMKSLLPNEDNVLLKPNGKK